MKNNVSEVKWTKHRKCWTVIGCLIKGLKEKKTNKE